MDPCEECPIKAWNVQKTQIIKNLEFQNDELKKRLAAQERVIDAARAQNAAAMRVCQINGGDRLIRRHFIGDAVEDHRNRCEETEDEIRILDAAEPKEE